MRSKLVGPDLSGFDAIDWTASLLAEKKANSKKKNGKDKETDELDQVAGNAEDEIGDRIAAVRETELLYGPDSLLAVYGDMIVHICRMPHKFKVSTNCHLLRSLDIRFDFLQFFFE